MTFRPPCRGSPISLHQRLRFRSSLRACRPIVQIVAYKILNNYTFPSGFCSIHTLRIPKKELSKARYISKSIITIIIIFIIIIIINFEKKKLSVSLDSLCQTYLKKTSWFGFMFKWYQITFKISMDVRKLSTSIWSMV